MDRGAWWAAVHGVSKESDLVTKEQVYVCQSRFPNSSQPPPSLYPYICSLCLCLCFCFANKFICIIFLDSTYMGYYTMCFSLSGQGDFLKCRFIDSFPWMRPPVFTCAFPTILWVWPVGLCFIPSVHSSLISCHVPLTSLSPSFKHGRRAAPSIQDDFLSLLQLPTVQVLHFPDQSSHPWGSLFSSPWLVQIYY